MEFNEKEIREILQEVDYKELSNFAKQEFVVDVPLKGKKPVVIDNIVEAYLAKELETPQPVENDEDVKAQVETDIAAVKEGIARLTVLLKQENPEAKRKALLNKRKELEKLL